MNSFKFNSTLVCLAVFLLNIRIQKSRVFINAQSQFVHH